jgi:hypothetical protein
MNVDNMAFELPEEYASDYYIDDPRVLSSLELAKYVLLRLTNNRDTIKKIAEDLDDDEYFISGVVDFLSEVGWIKKDNNGNYQMTTKRRNGMKMSSKRGVTNKRVTKLEA